MTYFVNDISYTLQGEGYWTGRPAVFVRFSRCNLWTGKEKDRGRSVCQFCDTDFTEAPLKFEDGVSLRAAIADTWPSGKPNPMVVFTGGEPMLQLERNALYTDCGPIEGFYTALETNGTINKPDVLSLIDWVCVSPKVNAILAVHKGNELKLVYPQGPDPSAYLGSPFDHFWLSPMDGPSLAENTAAAVEYVKANPRWRLNTQTHKAVGIR